MVAMKPVARIYDGMLAEHLTSHRQTAFFGGPRQAGKTTACRSDADSYANGDNIDDRAACRSFHGPFHPPPRVWHVTA